MYSVRCSIAVWQYMLPSFRWTVFRVMGCTRLTLTDNVGISGHVSFACHAIPIRVLTQDYNLLLSWIKL